MRKKKKNYWKKAWYCIKGAHTNKNANCRCSHSGKQFQEGKQIKNFKKWKQFHRLVQKGFTISKHHFHDVMVEKLRRGKGLKLATYMGTSRHGIENNSTLNAFRRSKKPFT